MKTKILITTLFLAIFLVSFVSAYDSGWIDFHNNDAGACGRGYPSCNKNSYGLAWLQELVYPTGANYGFLCQNGACNMALGAGMGQYVNAPESGDYYVMIDARWDPESGEDLYTGVGNFGQDSLRRLAFDFDTETKCVYEDTFSFQSGNNKIWVEAAENSGSVHVDKFRLTTCIPNENDLVYCDSGLPAIPTCIGPVPTPVAPNVQITSPEARTYDTRNIIIDAVADQDISQWSYSVDNGPEYILIPGLAYQFDDNSCYDLTVLGSNSNGVGTDSVTFCINTSLQDPVDPTPAPNVTILSPINNYTYNTTLIQINVTANQNIDTWLIEINHGSTNTFVPGGFKIFTEGCWNVIVYGRNGNGVGRDSVDFCVNLTVPANETNQTDQNPSRNEPCCNGCDKDDDEDDKEVNPYDLPEVVEDIILFRNNRTAIILGADSEDENTRSIYPVLIGLLLLGIIVVLILIMLVSSGGLNGGGKDKDNDDKVFYGAVDEGVGGDGGKVARDNNNPEGVIKNEVFY